MRNLDYRTKCNRKEETDLSQMRRGSRDGGRDKGNRRKGNEKRIKMWCVHARQVTLSTTNVDLKMKQE